MTCGCARVVQRVLFSLAVVVAGAFVLPAGSLRAQGVAADECCKEMLIPIGARTIGLGQALTTRGGRESVFFNPAGLIDVADDEFVIHRSQAGSANLTTFGVLVRSSVAGVFGVTYTFQDWGLDDHTDEFGNVLGRFGQIGQSLVASFATNFRGGWSAGVNYRLWDFRSTCEGFCGPDADFAGTTHMVDAGLRFRPALRSLMFGASLLHAGFPLQIVNKAQADVSPARLRLGAAYETARLFVKDTTVTAWVHVDAVQRVRDLGSWAVNFGVEVGLDETIFLRAGHATEGDGVSSGGTGIGVGFKHRRFDVGASRTLSASPLFEAEPFHITFSMTF